MKRVVPFAVLLTCLGFGIIAFRACYGGSGLTICRVPWIRSSMKDLRIGLESYRIEYGHFPGQPGQDQTSDVRVTTVGPLVDCLNGEKSEWNPKAIKFIDFLDARDGRSGYIPAAGDNPIQVVDSWGQPFVILLDTDGDKRVRNPDISNADPAVSRSSISPPPEFLPASVLVFSLGQDKIEGTGDDVVSWRSSSANERSAWWLDRPRIILSLLVLLGGAVVFLVWFIGFRQVRSLPPDGARGG